MIIRIYKKYTTDVTLDDGRPNAFPLTSKTTQECPLLLLFNIELEILGNAIKLKKKKRYKAHRFERKM